MNWLTNRLAACQTGCDSDDPVTCIDDDEPVTHYGVVPDGGTDPEFRNNVRSHEPGMSVQIGRRTAEEMCRHIQGTPTEKALARAAVRYSTAGTLREAGFSVVHTPGTMKFQKQHATVMWIAAGKAAEDGWPNGVREAFDACFNAT